ncbi:MAG: N-acetylmuramoyl-L-alanine amidase [Clostridia bacterium]
MKNRFIATFLTLLLISVLYHDEKNIQTVWNNENFNDSILIIDAGHGGLDGGAVSVNGICEQYITLNISKKADYLCTFLGISSILTRNDDNSLDFNPSANIKENKVADTKARTDFVNSFENPFLISVHLNSFTDSQYHGAQIFYNNYDISENLANILQSQIKNSIDFSNERNALLVPASIYLIENTNCPAIIYECGFLSNEIEEKLLDTQEYQTKLAICMISSYSKIQKELNYETKNSISML